MVDSFYAIDADISEALDGRNFGKARALLASHSSEHALPEEDVEYFTEIINAREAAEAVSDK